MRRRLLATLLLTLLRMLVWVALHPVGSPGRCHAPGLKLLIFGEFEGGVHGSSRTLQSIVRSRTPRLTRLATKMLARSRLRPSLVRACVP